METLIIVHQFYPYSTHGTESLALQVARELRKRGNAVRVVCGKPIAESVDNEFSILEEQFDRFPVYRVIYRDPNPETFAERTLRNKRFGASFLALLKAHTPDRAMVFHTLGLSPIVLEILGRMNIPTIYVATDYWTICPKGTLLRSPGNRLCTGPSALSANCVRCLITDSLGQNRPRTTTANDPLRIVNLPNAKFFASLVRRGFFASLLRRGNYFRRQISRLRAIIVPTEFMAELFSGRGIPRELIRVIPYGFDVTPAETTEKAKLLSFGYVGSINEHKGAHVLITAFKKANVQDKATLSLYGDLDIAKPSYAEQLRQSVAENPAIRLLGSFPSEQASKIISSFDVLVIPSIWYENTPTVIHIAFACKIPIIGSNVPGITELVKNEINGLIFERGDTDQLSSQIRRVVETPELLRNMSLSMPKTKPIHDYVDQLEKCF